MFTTYTLGKGDTLLVTACRLLGFGKSIVFHDFSILTGKISLQIIPLSKLSDEQLDDQLSRRNVLTISCSYFPQKAVRWFSWCTMDIFVDLLAGQRPGLDRGLESAGTGVAHIPLEASVLNIMCEGRKWLSNRYIYREFGVDFGYKIPR